MADDLEPCPDLATANPADVLEWLSKRNGRELPQEWIGMLRDYCNEPVGPGTVTIRLPFEADTPEA